jgi:hypothetical protein
MWWSGEERRHTVIIRQKFDLSTVILGGQAAIAMDWQKSTPSISVLADVVSGTATYALEFTMDDLAETDIGDIRWHNSSEMPSATAGTRFANITYPVTGLRMNIQSITGEMRVTVIQGASD